MPNLFEDVRQKLIGSGDPVLDRIAGQPHRPDLDDARRLALKELDELAAEHHVAGDDEVIRRARAGVLRLCHPTFAPGPDPVMVPVVIAAARADLVARITRRVTAPPRGEYVAQVEKRDAAPIKVRGVGHPHSFGRHAFAVIVDGAGRYEACPACVADDVERGDATLTGAEHLDGSPLADRLRAAAGRCMDRERAKLTALLADPRAVAQMRKALKT